MTRAVEAVVRRRRGAGTRDRRRGPEAFGGDGAERRVAFLKAYQSGRYARTYKAFVDKVAAAETAVAPAPRC